MFELILMTAMTMQPQPTLNAQFKPCVWPNVCKTETVAQFRPCVWPNKCGKKLAGEPKITTCAWPNTCA